jgi:hypothetical protein
MSDHYKLHGMTEWRGEIVDLAYRRVRPLLDQPGLQTRSVEHLMAEAYMQGIKDAVAAQVQS